MFEPETLIELRSAVSALDRSRTGLKPYLEIHRLASVTPSGSELLIDLDASDLLGMPMLVFRSPEPSKSQTLSCLSPREKEVASLIAEGLLNKQIAVKLSISLGTVKDHIHNILKKADLPNRAAIASAHGSIRFHKHY